MLEFLRRAPPPSTLREIFRQSHKSLFLSRPSLTSSSNIPSSFSTSSWIGIQRSNTYDSTNPPDQGSTKGSQDLGSTCDQHFKLSKERMQQLSKAEANCPTKPVYNEAELSKVEVTHFKPKQMHHRVALLGVHMMRTGFDIASRYKGPGGGMTKRDWLNRCLFLETVAGVPGTYPKKTRTGSAL